MSGAGSSRQTLERSSSRWTSDSDVLISEDCHCGGIGDLNILYTIVLRNSRKIVQYKIQNENLIFCFMAFQFCDKYLYLLGQKLIFCS